MKIPILTLKETLDSLLEWISSNYTYYNNLTTPEESWLYDTFDGNIHGNFNFYTQLVAIMSRTSKHSRKLETRLMFDNTRANLPTIHIHMPGEAKGGFTSLNAQTGGGEINSNNTFTQNLSRSSTSTYELIITGSNSEEVIAIYEILQTIFIAGHDTLQNNFETFEYAGAELMANPELIPYNTFFRAFRITIGYERVVKSIASFPTVSNIYFNGSAVGTISPAYQYGRGVKEVIPNISVETNIVIPANSRLTNITFVRISGAPTVKASYLFNLVERVFVDYTPLWSLPISTLTSEIMIEETIITVFVSGGEINVIVEYIPNITIESIEEGKLISNGVSDFGTFSIPANSRLENITFLKVSGDPVIKVFYLFEGNERVFLEDVLVTSLPISAPLSELILTDTNLEVEVVGGVVNVIVEFKVNLSTI